MLGKKVGDPERLGPVEGNLLGIRDKEGDLLGTKDGGDFSSAISSTTEPKSKLKPPREH